jgi:hypothetical protein
MVGLASGDNPPGFVSFTAGEKVGLGAVGVGAVGMIIGGIAGAALPGDRWEEIPLGRVRVSIAPQLHGTFAFDLSVSF